MDKGVNFMILCFSSDNGYGTAGMLQYCPCVLLCIAVGDDMADTLCALKN